MSGSELPTSSHVVRHCPTKYLNQDTTISSSAFQLRNNEEYLSVSWVEYYDQATGDLEKDIDIVREGLQASGRKIGVSHKLAVLNVGATKDFVQQNTFDSRELLFKYHPSKDKSHSGIHNIEPNQLLISELILETLVADFPGRL